MRHTTCLMVAAALLAAVSGCQSMPTLDQPLEAPPMMDSSNALPLAQPQVVDQAPIVSGESCPTIVGDEGMGYAQGGYGCGSSGCGGNHQMFDPGYPGHGLQARNMHHVFQGPHGPSTGQVTYPYYTLRGPRDFLLDNPPSLGP